MNYTGLTVLILTGRQISATLKTRHVLSDVNISDTGGTKLEGIGGGKMKIKVNRIGIVDVLCKECPNYECFSPHHYQHRNQTIDGNVSQSTDKELSCSYRNYNGCPQKPIINNNKRNRNDK